MLLGGHLHGAFEPLSTRAQRSRLAIYLAACKQHMHEICPRENAVCTCKLRSGISWCLTQHIALNCLGTTPSVVRTYGLLAAPLLPGRDNLQKRVIR